jgi:hypothetical protein
MQQAMRPSLPALHNSLIDLAAIADLCYDNQEAAKKLRDAADVLARGIPARRAH